MVITRSQCSSYPALQTHCTENLKQIFPEMKLRGLVPKFHIHVSVSDLYVQDRSAYFAAK